MTLLQKSEQLQEPREKLKGAYPVSGMMEGEPPPHSMLHRVRPRQRAGPESVFILSQLQSLPTG